MTLEDFTEFGDDEGDGGDDAAADPATAGRGGTERDGEDATDGADKNSIDGDGEDATDGGFAAYDVEPTGEDVGLGVVSVSQGLRVAEDADETTLKAFVTAGNREAVRLGKYLLVPYPDGERLFCRITGLEYAQEFRSDDATGIHARRQMRRDDFAERDDKFMAELEPMSVVYGPATT